MIEILTGAYSLYGIARVANYIYNYDATNVIGGEDIKIFTPPITHIEIFSGQKSIYKRTFNDKCRNLKYILIDDIKYNTITINTPHELTFITKKYDINLSNVASSFLYPLTCKLSTSNQSNMYYSAVKSVCRFGLVKKYASYSRFKLIMWCAYTKRPFFTVGCIAITIVRFFVRAKIMSNTSAFFILIFTALLKYYNQINAFISFIK